jgi:hypothetical protein
MREKGQGYGVSDEPRSVTDEVVLTGSGGPMVRTTTGHLIGGIYYGGYWGEIYYVVGPAEKYAPRGVRVRHLGGRGQHVIGEERDHLTALDDRDQLLPVVLATRATAQTKTTSDAHGPVRTAKPNPNPYEGFDEGTGTEVIQ